ncbi:aminopeptidase P2 [Elaeis guineensis]|uniref:Aminopeptidase P2 isoform X2 n=1 Tax=Elaeis guineensis var. tenera TaxID=51953 RepID=A0A6I9RZE5_ELAGV|nr:aminopeptidase P2 isoform X2 [Elaeis guineensis]
MPFIVSSAPMEAAAASSSPLSAFFSRPASRLRPRGFRFLALSLPFFGELHTQRCVALRPRYLRFSVAARSFGDKIVARPSSEFRKKQSSGSRTEDEKLRALRDLFSRPGIGIDAYIIPSQDAHQSEFIAECFMRRAYITGFTGSAGTAVITKEKAALWTDGRYFLQAEKQLSCDWKLMRSGNLGVPTTTEWLNDVLAPGCRVGIDPFLFSSDAAEELKEAISKKNHELVFIYDFNLVDEIWGESRPKPPMKWTRVHDIKYAGVDVSAKLSSLRSELMETGCTAIVISMLDEVAWLLNMRGNDVPHSPVFYSYLIVEVNSAQLFIDKAKVTMEVMDHLKSAGIELKPYESILSEIESLAAQGAKLWLDTSSVNAALVSRFKSACNKHLAKFENKARDKVDWETSPDMAPNKHQDARIEGPSGLYKPSPVILAKAVKNKAEIDGMRSCHFRDAAALAEFWAWMEEEIHNNAVPTEVEVADKLLEFRKKQAGFMDTSFDTISGYGANGAVIHYKPEPDSCSVVDDKNLFLLDSGGQYVDGTTDITRTVHFGEPTPQQKECFTRVLQGHIALDQAVFPEHTPGFVLDVLARSSLWKVGLDYRHGTGHGVGAALNVHEGPQSISFRYGNMAALQKGMVVSNEPGYYEDNSFGIRIENLLHVKEVKLPNCFGGIGYLGFEKLTFVPIQSKLVDISLLSPMEINWLNDYHSQVWDKVSPLLDGSAREWLWNNTRPLPAR